MKCNFSSLHYSWCKASAGRFAPFKSFGQALKVFDSLSRDSLSAFLFTLFFITIERNEIC